MEKTKKTKKQKVQTHGQGLGRGLAGDMGLNFLFFCFFFCVFVFSMVFCSLAKTSRTPKKTKKNKQFRPMGKVWAIHTQTKKPKNQETKKPKKTKKNKIAHPKGRGSDAECWVLSFCFFLFFWFFHGFLQFGQNLENTKKTKKKPKSSDPWARSGLSTHKPKNQKTKKTKNQETKKPKKPRLHTPRGGGQMQSVGSCLFVFFVFWFFGLCVDSHCRCAKQRLPGTVSGCTRSKVDTLQYSNVCCDIVHSANEQQRGMEFNFVRLRHMLLDLCTGNAAICALPQWPVL